MASDPDPEATLSIGSNAVRTVALLDPPPLQRRGGTLALRHATGLLLFKGSNHIAKGFVKPIVNTISRLLGRPQSVKSDIEDFFGDDDKREKCLDDLHGNPNSSLGRLSVLQRHCHKLLAFADAESSTVATQRVTFRIVVAVTTRYPGVRRLFHSYKDLKKASETDPPFHLLWSRPHQPCDGAWMFYRNFALFCISESNLTELVEAEAPSRLSRIRSERNDSWVPIETLLWHSSDGPGFHFPRLCAILYLAGILELPSFWRRLPSNAITTGALGRGSERQLFFDVLRKLCNAVLELIQDSGGDGATNVASSSEMGFARYAVDLLACSTLNGVHRLHRDRNLHPCPKELPTSVQDIVSAVLSDDTFVRACALAPAVKDILVPSPGLPPAADDGSSPEDNQSEHANEIRRSQSQPAAVSRTATPYGQGAPSVVSPDGASTISSAGSAGDLGPFSGADAAIMANAFRTALRKPDYAGRPVEEEESPEHDNPELTEDELLSRELSRTATSHGQGAPSVVSPDGASTISSAGSAGDLGPFSGADAAIMANAFRTALRKPDFAGRPVEEGESPESTEDEL